MFRPLCSLLVLLLSAAVCSAQQAATSSPPITLAPYEPGGIYALGETVGWRVSARAGAPAADYTYTAKKNDLEIIKTGRREDLHVNHCRLFHRDFDGGVTAG